MAPPHNQFHPNQTGLCPALRRSSTKIPSVLGLVNVFRPLAAASAVRSERKFPLAQAILAQVPHFVAVESFAS